MAALDVGTTGDVGTVAGIAAVLGGAATRLADGALDLEGARDVVAGSSAGAMLGVVTVPGLEAAAAALPIVSAAPDLSRVSGLSRVWDGLAAALELPAECEGTAVGPGRIGSTVGAGLLAGDLSRAGAAAGRWGGLCVCLTMLRRPWWLRIIRLSI